MGINVIQRLVNNEQTVFDYTLLKSMLSSLKYPRDKIKILLRNEDIIRVKKGLYILGPKYGKPYSRNILANLIYGPSYISLDYALSYYGLIPESVHEVTSVTNRRKKYFKTPVGIFSYMYLNNEKYSVGIRQLEDSFLIASPEKALSDKLASMNLGRVSKKSLTELLEGDLRLDMDGFVKLNGKLLADIADAYKNASVDTLCRLIGA